LLEINTTWTYENERRTFLESFAQEKAKQENLKTFLVIHINKELRELDTTLFNEEAMKRLFI